MDGRKPQHGTRLTGPGGEQQRGRLVVAGQLTTQGRVESGRAAYSMANSPKRRWIRSSRARSSTGESVLIGVRAAR